MAVASRVRKARIEAAQRTGIREIVLNFDESGIVRKKRIDAFK